MKCLADSMLVTIKLKLKGILGDDGLKSTYYFGVVSELDRRGSNFKNSSDMVMAKIKILV